MTKSILSTVYQSLFSRYSGMILTFVSLALITQYMGAEFLGVYTIAFGFSSSFCYLSGLGSSDGLVKYLSKTGQTQDTSNIVRANYFYSLYLAIFFLSLVCSLWFYDLVSLYFWYVFIWVVAWGMNFCSAQSLVVLKKERVASYLFYSFPAFFSFFSVLICIVMDFKDPNSLVLMNAISFVFLNSIGAFLLFSNLQQAKEKDMPNRHIFGCLVLEGIVFSVGRVFQSVILWLPVWMCGYVYSKEAAGICAIYMRLAVAVGAVMSSIRFTFRKLFVDLLMNGHRARLGMILSALGSVTSLIAITASIANALFGEYVIGAVFGHVVADYHYAFSLLMFAIVFECFYYSSEDLLKTLGLNKFFYYSHIFFLVTQFGLGFFLSYYFGWLGFLYAYVVQVFLYNFFLNTLIRRKAGVFIVPMFSFRALRLLSNVRY
jgi:O-antigen/teichoic acid export membrane protein